MRRINIVQGEHAVVGEADVMVSTVLGSCIAACLFDPVARVGGMNHFLLGEPAGAVRPGQSDLQRYGVHAMEMLINAMMQRGARRERMRAHLYGGATMVASLGAIGRHNAAFARRFVATEGIAIGHEDLGGEHARRVEFLPFEGKARCRRVASAPVPEAVAAPVLAGGELELF